MKYNSSRLIGGVITGILLLPLAPDAAEWNSGVKGQTAFSLAWKDPEMVELIGRTDHKALGEWALECAERVMPYFEQAHPDDPRPRKALETLQAWMNTGVFKMAVIRKASLDAHAAAKDVGEDRPARSAAHAAGQAVATAHVPTHSIGAANYAAQAVFRAAASSEAAAAVARERQWQGTRLRQLSEQHPLPPP